MKAAQVFDYRKPLRVVDVAEPTISGPFDIIVRIAGAGVCRTDLHIVDGILQEAMHHPPLPYTIGHENAGWVEQVGPAVDTLAPGDPVVLHPIISCGFCRACRMGNESHCARTTFPGVDGSPGGYAELFRTTARAAVKLAPGTDPASLAPYADAGLTAYHAIKKIVGLTYPGSTLVVIGIGGLGHFGVQLARLMTTARIVGIDTQAERLDFARSMGADLAIAGADGGVREVLDYTDGAGADVIVDFVAEGGTPAAAIPMLRNGGTYSVVGYGGVATATTLEIINREINIVGNKIGTHSELTELMELAHQDRIRITAHRYPLEDVADVLAEFEAGHIMGRAVLVPANAA